MTSVSLAVTRSRKLCDLLVLGDILTGLDYIGQSTLHPFGTIYSRKLACNSVIHFTPNIDTVTHHSVASINDEDTLTRQ